MVADKFAVSIEALVCLVGEFDVVESDVRLVTLAKSSWVDRDVSVG